VRLTVQGEVMGGTILQQNAVVELEVHNQQCTDCQRSFTPHEGWKAVVQLRQKVTHKRTFLFLEQLMLKHKAHAEALRIKDQRDGLDFFFPNKSAANKFVDFVQNVSPAKYKQSKKLVSQDFNSNNANFTYSFSVEIAHVCKDDLVLLPLKVANSFGSISPLLFVARVTSMVHLIDPVTLQHADVNGQQFWMHEFQTVADRTQQVEFHILDIEPLGPVRGKTVLAEAVVAKDSDFGHNNITYTTVTHLGGILRPGDRAFGYDIASLNANADFSHVRHALPDVILARKHFAVPRRRKRRVFKLARIDKEELELKGRGKKEQEDKQAVEFEEFVRDLEEDPELRGKINLYPKTPQDEIASQVSTAVGTVEEDPTFPEVQLEELIADLSISRGAPQ